MKRDPKTTIMSLYKITCLLDGRVYIGQTNTPDKRWSAHKSAARAWIRDQSQTGLLSIDQEMGRLGIENFTYEVIACTIGYNNANEAEKELIIQEGSHVSTGNGFNKRWGGHNAPMAEETKELLSGENHWNSELTNEQVLQIVELYKTGEYTHRELASMFDVCNGTIGSIVLGTHWSHLTSISSENALYAERKGARRYIDSDGVIRNVPPRKAKGDYTILDKSHPIYDCSRGDNNGSSKLTNEQVSRIIDLYADSQYGYDELAQMFDVSRDTIYHIVSGRGWISISGIEEPIFSGIPKGEGHYLAKITTEQATEIVKLYETSLYSQEEIGTMFSVSRGTVDKIVSGKTWKEATGITPDTKLEHRRPPVKNETRRKMSESGKLSINAGRFKPKIEWPEDQVLIAMVNENGLSKTAKALDITPSSLYEHMEKRGLQHSRSRTIKSERMTAERALELVALYQGGRTKKQLAEQLNISIGTVNGILAGRAWSKETGIKPAKKSV